MSQQSNITVFDGATTPVSHVLVPADNKVLKDGTRLAVWRENLPSLPVEAQVRVELYQREFPGSKVVETRAVVVTPVMESISGVNTQGYTASPKVAYEDRVEIRQLAHRRSTVASRRLCKQIALNFASNIMTTVTPVSAGVVDEAATQLFMPS
jgi:hypothetical protein